MTWEEHGKYEEHERWTEKEEKKEVKARIATQCPKDDKRAKTTAYKSDSMDRETRNIANSGANSGSIRPLLTPAAITADIEVLISFLSPLKVYAGITDFMPPLLSLGLGLFLSLFLFIFPSCFFLPLAFALHSLALRFSSMLGAAGRPNCRQIFAFQSAD